MSGPEDDPREDDPHHECAAEIRRLEDQVERLQCALAGWLPVVYGDDSALDEQVAQDAFLLVGMEGEQKHKFGDIMREGRERAEHVIGQHVLALRQLLDIWDAGMPDETARQDMVEAFDAVRKVIAVREVLKGDNGS